MLLKMISHKPSSPTTEREDRLINGFISAVKNCPAADVRPVVRGKWKVSVHKTYYDVSCSVCGINSFFQVDEKDSVSYANYCPNCGAMMEES